MDGCKEICQRQTEMEKARRPMFQQELEELRSKDKMCVVCLEFVYACPRLELRTRCGAATATQLSSFLPGFILGGTQYSSLLRAARGLSVKLIRSQFISVALLMTCR